MELELALHDLQAIELRLEALYAWFAQVYADDPAAAELFAKMSVEERSHAELVRSQLKLVAADPEAVVDMDHVVSWEEVQQLLARIEALQSSPLPPPLEQAVAAAIEFESSGAELYSVRSMVHGRREIRELLARLTEANQHHHQRLLQFARTLNSLTIG